MRSAVGVSVSRSLNVVQVKICPTVAADKPRIEVHPLGIGGKTDPAEVELLFLWWTWVDACA